MRPHNFPHESRQLGRAWFAIPLSVFAALVASLVMVTWPDAAGMHGDVASTEALAVLPYGSASYGVPAAASVFTERQYEVAEHVDTF